MIEISNLTKLAKEVHVRNAKKGFYDDPKSNEKFLIDMVEEIGEMNNALRKNIRAAAPIEPIDEHQFVEENKQAFEYELADLIIRCLDTAGYFNIDLDFFIRTKLEYNATRPYKHGKIS